MRKLTVSVLSMLLAACSGAAASVPDDDGGGERLAEAPAATPGGGNATQAAPASGLIEVHGHVAQYDGTGVAEGVVVRIIDAAGTAHDATSFSDGGFRFADIKAPYDLIVRAPASTPAEPRVYLGLTRSDLELRNPFVNALQGHSFMKANVVFTAAMPACGTELCEVAMGTSSSNHGLGGDSASGIPSAAQSFTIGHQWLAPDHDPTSAHLALDVIVSNQAYTKYWYAHVDGGLVTPGATVNLGAVDLQPIGTIGPVTMTPVNEGIPDAWSRNVSFALIPSGGPMLALQSADASSLATFLPDVPGATMHVSASARAKSTDARLESLVYADLPLSPQPISLPLRQGIEPIYPMPAGAFSRATNLVKWEPTPGRAVQVEISGSGAGVIATLVEGELSLTRLAALGITLADGNYGLTLSSTEDTSSDDAFAPGRPASNDTNYRTTAFQFVVAP